MIRKLFGAVLIITGIAISASSFFLWPNPFDWLNLLITFTPVFIVGVGFMIIGWTTLTGMTVRDILDYLTYF